MTTHLPRLRRSALNANLVCMASMLIWAMAFPAVDLLLPVLPPLPLTALRMALAVIFLAPLWVLIDGWGAPGRVNWVRAALVGGVGFGGGAVLLVIAQDLSDPVTVAVISSMMPVIGIALECLLDRRPITWFLLAALGLSVLGGTLTCAAGPGGLLGLSLGTGAALALVSCALFVVASRATVTGFPGLSPLGRTTVTLAGAAASTGVLALVANVLGAPSVVWGALGGREIGALMIYGIGSMAISQILWIIGVERLGVGIASMHINAAPFYVMLFLWLLGAPWNPGQAVGALVVGLAVLVALRGETRTD